MTTERIFNFELSVPLTDGSNVTKNLRVPLKVSSHTTSAEILRAFWYMLAENGIQPLFGLPLFETVRGFIVTKITEVPEYTGEFTSVPREEMSLRYDEPVKFRLRADAVMHDGRTRNDEYAGTVFANSAAEAKREIWRKILANDAPWCETAAEVESVTFRAEVRKPAPKGTVFYEYVAPSPEGEAQEEGLTADERHASAHNGGIDSGDGLIDRYRIHEGVKEVYCEGDGCTKYFPVDEFDRCHRTHPVSWGNPLVHVA